MFIYELASIASFVAALLWALRSRNPVNLGAVLGGFMLFVFDWLWCSRGFFNATVAPNLVMFPGIHIHGLEYPIAIACNWSVGFGLGPLLLSKCHPGLSRKLGRLHFPIVFAAWAAFDIVIEATLISGLGVYTYHQAPHFLFWGVAWSNILLLGGLLTLSYFGLAHVQALMARLDYAGMHGEEMWQGFFLAAGTILASALLLTLPLLFWYSAATPWIESGRPF